MICTWFFTVILHSDSLWEQDGRHYEENTDKMALIFLIVDGLGSLNMQIDLVVSSEPAGVIVFVIQVYP